MTAIHEKPCAAHGLVSFRYRQDFGYIMIGAKDQEDAVREVKRTTNDALILDRLEVWDPAVCKYRDLGHLASRKSGPITSDSRSAPS